MRIMFIEVHSIDDKEETVLININNISGISETQVFFGNYHKVGIIFLIHPIAIGKDNARQRIRTKETYEQIKNKLLGIIKETHEKFSRFEIMDI